MALHQKLREQMTLSEPSSSSSQPPLDVSYIVRERQLALGSLAAEEGEPACASSSAAAATMPAADLPAPASSTALFEAVQQLAAGAFLGLQQTGQATQQVQQTGQATQQVQAGTPGHLHLQAKVHLLTKVHLLVWLTQWTVRHRGCVAGTSATCRAQTFAACGSRSPR